MDGEFITFDDYEGSDDDIDDVRFLLQPQISSKHFKITNKPSVSYLKSQRLYDF